MIADIQQNSMDIQEYKDYYVAFIDILGFKKIVDGEDCNKISQIFNTLANAKLLDAIKFPVNSLNIPLEDVKRYIMSDSIVFYIESKRKNSLRALLIQCQWLSFCLMKNNPPIFVRGGISKGGFYRGTRNKSIVFGPALTSAFLLENNCAHTPRIIMLKETFDQGVQNDIDDERELNIITYCDCDEYRCVDTLEYLKHDLNSYVSVQTYIQNVLDTEPDESIRQKFLYLKQRMNVK